MPVQDIICKTLDILGHKVILLARNALKLFCFFRLVSWKSAVYLGKPSAAIAAIAVKLGKAGASIDAEEALRAINSEIESVIPQLGFLKQSKNVALTEITETHTIDQISISIGIPMSTNNILGAAIIDGIGFRVEATKMQ